VAPSLSRSILRPRRELEDGPGECGGIDAIEGDRVETIGTQVIETQCLVEQNDRSPFLRLRQPSLAGPPQLFLEGIRRQQVDDYAMCTQERIDNAAAGGCQRQTGRPGIPTIVVGADGPPPDIEMLRLEGGAFVKASAPHLRIRVRTA